MLVEFECRGSGEVLERLTKPEHAGRAGSGGSGPSYPESTGGPSEDNTFLGSYNQFRLNELRTIMAEEDESKWLGAEVVVVGNQWDRERGGSGGYEERV